MANLHALVVFQNKIIAIHVHRLSRWKRSLLLSKGSLYFSLTTLQNNLSSQKIGHAVSITKCDDL